VILPRKKPAIIVCVMKYIAYVYKYFPNDFIILEFEKCFRGLSE
jgi:hypothetical protein